MGQPLGETVWRFLKNIKHARIQRLPSRAFTPEKQRHVHTQKKTCLCMSIATLFVSAPNWKQLRRPATGGMARQAAICPSHGKQLTTRENGLLAGTAGCATSRGSAPGGQKGYRSTVCTYGEWTVVLSWLRAWQLWWSGVREGAGQQGSGCGSNKTTRGVLAVMECPVNLRYRWAHLGCDVALYSSKT